MNKYRIEHLLKYFEKNLRYDGRKKDEFREVKVTYGVSKSAEGSAEVRIGDTVVIAGVKMAVQAPYSDRPDEGGLMVNAEFLPLASEKFESGPPSIEAIELARVCDRGIRESKSIDNKKLCITPGEKVWMVSVDVCTINAAGNLLDACALACMAAIKDARFPAYDPETGVVDYKTKTKTKLPLSKDPIAVTIYKIGDHMVLDPLVDEEEAAEARLTVTVTDAGKACSLQKNGDGLLTIDQVDEMVGLAIKTAKKLRKSL